MRAVRMFTPGDFLEACDEAIPAKDALYMMRLGQLLEDPFLQTTFFTSVTEVGQFTGHHACGSGVLRRCSSGRS